MKIMLISNDGAGFAGHVEVMDNTTVGALFTQRMGTEANPNNYTIRVNRQPATFDQVLRPDDRVAFAPSKVAGAA